MMSFIVHQLRDLKRGLRFVIVMREPRVPIISNDELLQPFLLWLQCGHLLLSGFLNEAAKFLVPRQSRGGRHVRSSGCSSTLAEI